MKRGAATIGGKKYPMIFNATVLINLEKYKNKPSEKALQELLEGGSASDTFWLLHECVEQGCAYAKYLGEEAPDVPSVDEIAFLVGVDEFGDITKELFETVQNGQRADLDTTGKKAEPTT